MAGDEEARQTAPGQTPPRPGFGERGRMRRRARFLRKARELAYRDLGGLVFDLHRFGQRNDSVVLAKLATLGQMDAELRALEEALHEIRPVTVLREVGIAACPRCAAIHGSDDRFCPGCGLAFDAGADRPLSTAPVTPTAPSASVAPQTAAARDFPASPAPQTAAAQGVAASPAPAAPGPIPSPASTGPATPGPIPSPAPTGPPAPLTPEAEPLTSFARSLAPAPEPSPPVKPTATPAAEPAPPVKPTAPPAAARPGPQARAIAGAERSGDGNGKRREPEDEDEPTQVLQPPTGT